MVDQDLAQLPINEFLTSNGLVCVWCTNSQNHIDTLVSVLFPIWNIKYVACWYWIKVLRFYMFDKIIAYKKQHTIYLPYFSPKKILACYNYLCFR